jgi:hypothetical protein
MRDAAFWIFAWVCVYLPMLVVWALLAWFAWPVVVAVAALMLAWSACGWFPDVTYPNRVERGQTDEL